MGFPRIVGSKTGKAILANSITITLPSGLEAGQTILILLASTTSTGDATLSDSSYTELFDEAHSSGQFGVELKAWYKVATGDELSFTLTLGSATAGYVYNVLLIDNLSDSVPKVADIVEGSSTDPDSDELYLGETSNALWLSVAAIDEAADVEFPEDYNIFNFYSSTAVGPTLAIAGYNYRTISEDPSAFYIVTSDQWLATTFAFVSNITTWQRYSSVRERSAKTTIWSMPTDDEHVLNTGSPEDLLLDPEDFDIDVARVQEHETVWTRESGVTVDWTPTPITTAEFYVSEI